MWVKISHLKLVLLELDEDYQEMKVKNDKDEIDEIYFFFGVTP